MLSVRGSSLMDVCPCETKEMSSNHRAEAASGGPGPPVMRGAKRVVRDVPFDMLMAGPAGKELCKRSELVAERRRSKHQQCQVGTKENRIGPSPAGVA
jgi:hypothetical protein